MFKLRANKVSYSTSLLLTIKDSTFFCDLHTFIYYIYYIIGSLIDVLGLYTVLKRTQNNAIQKTIQCVTL